MARYHAQTEMEFMSLSSCCRFSFFGYISTYSDGLSFVKFMLLVARKECDEAIVHFCISKNGSPELSFQLKNVSSALDVVVFGAIRIVCRQKLSNLCIVETGDRALVENNSKITLQIDNRHRQILDMLCKMIVLEYFLRCAECNEGGWQIRIANWWRWLWTKTKWLVVQFPKHFESDSSHTIVR